MKAKEFRTETREKLAGKWGEAALITFIYSCICFIAGILGGIVLPKKLILLWDLLYYVLIIPLTFGLNISYFKIFNGEETDLFDFIKDGFKFFKISLEIQLRIFFKMLISFVVLFASMFAIGFIFGVSSMVGGNSFEGILVLIPILYVVACIWMMAIKYKYEMANYIVIENPDINSKEALEKSWELMKGNRLKLVGLQLSFIGWGILSLFTIYIGLFWLVPYTSISTIAFYKHLKDKEKTEAVQEIVEEKPEEVVQEIEEKTEEVSEETEKVEDVSEENE